MGDLTQKIKSYPISHDAEINTITGTKYIHYGDIHTGKLKRITNEKILPNINDNNYIPLKSGDVIVADASEDYKGIADACVIDLMKEHYKIVSGLHTIVFRPNERLKSDFLYTYFHTPIFKHYGYRVGTGLKVFGITYNNLSNMEIKLPKIDEQNKVYKIINIVTNIITLQQRKLTELQLLRTSLNQQLLKDNSSWKSVKLREILNIRNKQIFPNQQYPLMSFVQKQGVVPKSQRYNRDFLVKGNKKYKVTEKGDFIYSSNNLETGSIGINKTGNATISPVYSVFSSKNYKESLFIGLLSEKKSFIYKMIRFRQGVVYGQWKIPEKDFLNITIKIPNYQEQEKIITLFTHIDNQFKQENKKLTDLQNFKQFLLQNMFIYLQKDITNRCPFCLT